MHHEDTARDAAITVRLPKELKRRIEQRAERQRRSLSAQVVHELEQALAQEPAGAPGKWLGRHAGTKVPTDADILEVRASLWGRAGRRDG